MAKLLFSNTKPSADGMAGLRWRNSSWLEAGDRSLTVCETGVSEIGRRGSIRTQSRDPWPGRNQKTSWRKNISVQAYRLNWPVNDGE